MAPLTVNRYCMGHKIEITYWNKHYAECLLDTGEIIGLDCLGTDWAETEYCYLVHEVDHVSVRAK